VKQWMGTTSKPGEPERYFLRTARLGFRCWSLADRSLALSLWGNPRVTRLIGGPFSAQDVDERLKREMETMAAVHVQYWPMFLLRTEEFVGAGGLRPYRSEPRVYELGFHLQPEYWGRGLAEEAGRAVVRFGFEQLGAASLFAGHHPENVASERVLRKLGFRRIGTEFYPPTGLPHPTYRMERPPSRSGSNPAST
jgi:[ribosomal protein S5]-alanine N-acetyltransferase